ncbi:MAG: RDD family protein [Pyrinomonadaceae bacterium]
MSAKAEKIVTAEKFKPKEIIADFQPERLKAPFALRCGALIIDYMLLIAAPVIALLIGRMLGEDGRKLLNSPLNNAGWLIALLVALTNFIIFPMVSGQSIGKMLTGLRVVKTDGTNPKIGTLLIRHLIGYPLIILTGGLGFLISALNSKGRALDDFLAGTIVIYGQRRAREIKN